MLLLSSNFVLIKQFCYREINMLGFKLKTDSDVSGHVIIFIAGDVSNI
jgi:hypothetical protein